MRKRLVTIAVAATSLLIAASAATAAGWKSESSISLVQPLAASSTTSGPHYGDQVTFAVTTTATDRPYVLLDCYQGGTWVSTAQAFYTPSTSFTLASGWWTGGAADCTATLGMSNAQGTKFTKLASTSFHVES
jgi:hypothetical protein